MIKDFDAEIKVIIPKGFIKLENNSKLKHGDYIFDDCFIKWKLLSKLDCDSPSTISEIIIRKK